MSRPPGFTIPQETRDKISAANKGRKNKPEVIAKMRALAIGRSVGDKNPAWRGGLLMSRGRVYEHTGHRRCYKARARRVAEESIGRPLRDDEDVHHINGVKDDDRPENLQVLTRAEHARHHGVTRIRDGNGRYT